MLSQFSNRVFVLITGLWPPAATDTNAARKTFQYDLHHILCELASGHYEAVEQNIERTEAEMGPLEMHAIRYNKNTSNGNRKYVKISFTYVYLKVCLHKQLFLCVRDTE
jgi:hypothetical protein